MAADLVTVAQAITDTINEQQWPLQFQAVRSYADWDEQLGPDGLDRLHVDVVPAGITQLQLADRGMVELNLAVDIGVRQAFSDQGHQSMETGRLHNEPLDELGDLFQQLALFWMGDRLAKHLGDCVWMDTEIRVPFVRDALREHRQFTAILRVTHQVTKVLP